MNDERDQLRREVEELRLCVYALGTAVLWAVALAPVRVKDPAEDIVRRVHRTLDRHKAKPADAPAGEG